MPRLPSNTLQLESTEYFPSAEQFGLEARTDGLSRKPAPRNTLAGSNPIPSTSRFQDLEAFFQQSPSMPIQPLIDEMDLLVRHFGREVPVRRFQVSQQFEGVVIDVTKDEFTAELIDLTDPSRPREVAEISLQEISPADQPLLAIGAVFYWIIGFEMSPGGQKSRVSEIRLRRHPVWSQYDIEQFSKEGKKLHEEFGGKDRNAS